MECRVAAMYVEFANVRSVDEERTRFTDAEKRRGMLSSSNDRSPAMSGKRTRPPIPRSMDLALWAGNREIATL